MRLTAGSEEAAACLWHLASSLLGVPVTTGKKRVLAPKRSSERRSLLTGQTLGWNTKCCRVACELYDHSQPDFQGGFKQSVVAGAASAAACMLKSAKVVMPFGVPRCTSSRRFR